MSSSLKYLPIYAIKKTFKYTQNISDERKLFKSWMHLISIWLGIGFGAVFPFFVWEDSVKFASKFFYVDPNWFISLMVVLTSISLFSNITYGLSKGVFYIYNYCQYNHFHSIFAPITESQIRKITGCQITLNDVNLILDRSQVLTIHRELLSTLKNKREKHKIKNAYEKFMSGDVIGAMIESPFVSHVIATTYDNNNDTTVSRAIRNKYTTLYMVTDRVNNPSECTLEGRLTRFGNRLKELQEEVVELLELAKQNEVMSVTSESTRSSIELSVLS